MCYENDFAKLFLQCLCSKPVLNCIVDTFTKSGCLYPSSLHSTTCQDFNWVTETECTAVLHSTAKKPWKDGPRCTISQCKLWYCSFILDMLVMQHIQFPLCQFPLVFVTHTKKALELHWNRLAYRKAKNVSFFGPEQKTQSRVASETAY